MMMPEKIYVSVSEKGTLRASSNEGVYNKNRAIYIHGDIVNARIAKLVAEVKMLQTALQGVIRVADRKTVEFDTAKQVLNGDTPCSKT
jgi:hypothetical protein